MLFLRVGLSVSVTIGNTKGAGGNLDNPVQHTLAVPFGGNFLVVFCVVGRVEWD